MSATHHPGEELLLAHASGAADEALSLIIGTHLALCPECRGKVARMETLGGAILLDMAPVAVSDGALQSVLSRLDDAPVTRRATLPPGPFAAPEPLRSYLGGDLNAVRWTHVTPGISYKTLFGSGASPAQLIRSRPGKGVGHHTHLGEELTLVLTGGFTDETGHYRRGDLQTADDTILHRPLADPGEDCIVLAVRDAPLRFRSTAVALIAKLFGF
ncbi:MAG TPA: ChrR family anti-sigma-E factor [Rhizomicrobium sp.]